MMSSKTKRRSFRRQWSVDVPSSIQKKFREVTNRSKSLDDDVSKQRLLDDDNDSVPCMYSTAPFQNFGSDEADGHCASQHSSWFSSEYNDETISSTTEQDFPKAWEKIDDIHIELQHDEQQKNSGVSVKKHVMVINGSSTSGLLSTIDEAPPRSPTKRTSPYQSDNDETKEIDDETNVPRKFARSEFSDAETESKSGNVDPGEAKTETTETAATDRHRRYAICEEMERYIIVNHKGLSLRKYRETLIRHRVLKELCLL